MVGVALVLVTGGCVEWNSSFDHRIHPEDIDREELVRVLQHAASEGERNSPRSRLLDKIFDQGFRTPDWRHDVPPPVVSLEDFFEGNRDSESMAVNLGEHPGLEFFYTQLKGIRSNSDVQAVLMNIYDVATVAYDLDDGWPSSENVHILTSAPDEVVMRWAELLRSDGAGLGWPYGKAEAAPKATAPMQWWVVTWD